MTTTASTSVAVRFLERGFEPEDWVAVFLKAYDTGRVLQRVGPVSQWLEPRWQVWLRVMNAHRFNIYVSVNALTPGRRDRTRTSVRTVRHVFLDLDRDADHGIRVAAARPDLPGWSTLIHSSPGRAQVLWRVTGFTTGRGEALQKRLARELDGDAQATSASQTMRIPGFENWKYPNHPLVTVEYRSDIVAGPGDFPESNAMPRNRTSPTDAPRPAVASRTPLVLLRARRYLAAVPVAVAGDGGDAATFRVCCRLVRGFALGTEDALSILRDWNERCRPPWTERELLAKLGHARRYGKEPVGGLLP